MVTCGMLSVKGSMRCPTPREVFSTKDKSVGGMEENKKGKRGKKMRKKKKRASSSLIYEERSCSSGRIYASRGRGPLLLWLIFISEP